ncbi:MAG: hypothetical protein D5R97_00570 [Candidatus Syntrophonatronum acetioxidans]|uniref:Uncharacterized protein n=1 Tax=Candidatus Syntrophonatronum acetioxidans TaxID=1795816 RepID=A0A424YIU7_9FIRM|nr:MAG: hypothetical protein D5R97_00570 [Candidatus Syntrophonatronum acetioxidans]
MNSKYEETTRKDVMVTVLALLIYLGLVFASVLWAPSYIAVFVMIAGLMILVNWHNRTFAYRCGECGRGFQVSPWNNLMSLHSPGGGGGWKYLQCPYCLEWSKAKILKIKKGD